MTLTAASCEAAIENDMSPEEMEIQSIFEKWLATVEGGSAEAVVKLYADDAILLPTLHGKVCDTQAKRLEYFKGFASRNPKGTVDEIYIRVHGDIAVNTGHYTFFFPRENKSAEARFSFVYKKMPQGWMIIDHHSSLVPVGHH